MFLRNFPASVIIRLEGLHLEWSSVGRLLYLLANISLARKGISGTNALAYLTAELVYKTKKFYKIDTKIYVAIIDFGGSG